MSELDKHIRAYDPAIDWSDHGGTPAEYLRSRDEKRLVIKPGRKPIVFYASRLSRSAYRWCSEAPTDSERIERAFRAGVRRVEHPDGTTWSPAGTDSRGYIAMTESESERYGIADVLEIGGLVFERSLVPPDCEVGYTLRPTSHHVLDAALRASHRAAQSRVPPASTASGPEDSSAV